LNFSKIKDLSLKWISVIAFLCGLFLSWDVVGFGDDAFKNCGEIVYIFRAFVLLGICFLIVLFSSIYVCGFRKRNKIWKRGSGAIILEYGDIFKLLDDESFQHIVAIPVNDTFDTIVDEDPTLVRAPLVSKETNHGKWIEFMKSRSFSVEEIDTKIKESLNKLDDVETEEISEEIKDRGNRIKYPIGTTAFVSVGNNVYCILVALSVFNRNNKAESNPRKLIKSICNLLEYYDEHGQGYDLYMPIMGAGMSRTNLDKQEAFEIMKTTVLANKWNIHGKVHIVIYEKEKADLSIFS
ncbi:MAG: hypothetical protein IKN43_11760, partial [Selenomonadaceae bacterium]|nr:hypothetical protein [Selenomonadaceae bacterium]